MQPANGLLWSYIAGKFRNFSTDSWGVEIENHYARAYTPYTMAAAECNFYHFTIFRSSSPETVCRYHRFLQVFPHIDSFQAQLVRCIPRCLHRQLRRLTASSASGQQHHRFYNYTHRHGVTVYDVTSLGSQVLRWRRLPTLPYTHGSHERNVLIFAQNSGLIIIIAVVNFQLYSRIR